MEQILLNGINVEQLLEKIEKLLDRKLEIKNKNDKNNSILLSRAEVTKLLKITLPTLHDWTKQGWLQSYKMGSRVFYKLEEVEQAIDRVSSNKNKTFIK